MADFFLLAALHQLIKGVVNRGTPCQLDSPYLRITFFWVSRLAKRRLAVDSEISSRSMASQW